MTARLAAAVAIALALPAAAQAATVSVYVPPCAPLQSKYGACYPDEARFAAAPGESNEVTVTRVPSEPPSYAPRLTIADAGAPLTAGAGCTQVDEHTASCTGYTLIAVIAAADGDDVVSGPAATVTGGDGNDTLSGAQIQDGGAGDDRLTASDTGSQLTGGPGRDTLSGGPVTDTFHDGGPEGEEDTIDGGGGEDVAAYGDRRTAVTVSLADLSANEDRLTSIESLRGGSGADKLTGDAGPNLLDGGPGLDVLDGGAGDDFLAGAGGADFLHGGAGSDMLDAGDDKAFSVDACGAGQDRAEPYPNTEIQGDCELIGLDDFETNGIARLHLPLRTLRSPVLTFEPLSCVFLPCSVQLTIKGLRGHVNRVVIGESRARQRRKRPALPKRMALRLGRNGRQHVRDNGLLRGRVRIAVAEQGEVDAVSFIVQMSLARRSR